METLVKPGIKEKQRHISVYVPEMIYDRLVEAKGYYPMAAFVRNFLCTHKDELTGNLEN